MDLLWSKITAMIILGVVSLILGLLPLVIGPKLGRNKFMRNTFLSVLLCFGGGVLMATCFTHILPEVIESFESEEATEHKPIGEIIFCAGFFLIYFIEELVHRTCDRQPECEEDEEHLYHSHSVHRSFSIHSQSCEAGHNELKQHYPVTEGKQSIPKRNGLIRNTVRNVLLNLDATVSPHSIGIAVTSNTMDLHHASDSDVSSSQSLKPNLEMNATTIRDFVTVLALSLHAVFEGLAIGLEEDVEGVWKLFAGVATHKFVISFCVGLELKMAGETPNILYVVYMATFAMVTPLGMTIGIVISEYKTEDVAYIMTVATLQGLAAGTLLYVVVFEVLQRERSKSVSGLIQLLFVVIGFTAMMCIDLFAGHEHEHEDHDHGDEEGGEDLLSTMSTLSTAVFQ